MKKLEKLVAKVVNETIFIDTFGWPPVCLGTMYQPERPKVKPDKNKINHVKVKERT